MRIAILNWSNRRAGGAETYLTTVIPEILRVGHQVGFWHEVDAPADRERIALPRDLPVWSVEALGPDSALEALRTWRPDLLYAHGLLDPAIEKRTLDIAPAVFLAHNYYGTCISGTKTFKNPVTTPCSRTFGWPCLLQYYPRRCGGLSPVTMVRGFRVQADRLELLSRYRAIVTLSTHMQQEYARHGLKASCVFDVHASANSQSDMAHPLPTIDRQSGDTWRLLFAGRMDELKGGRELLEALPRVARALQRRVHVTLAGEGPARQRWQRLAADMCAREPRLSVEFPGWIGGDAIQRLFASADLLVLPSLWPEPFGFVGLEAARHRLPVAAFAVGGIPEWLQPGVNGQLASGDPPTSDGLALAIVACLKDPDTHARLCDGAAQISATFTYGQHVDALLRVFADVARAA